MATATIAPIMDVFAGDDDETWRLLVALGDNNNNSSSSTAIDMVPLFAEVVTRLQEDWGIGKDYGVPSEEYWNVLVDRVGKYGFDYSNEVSKSPPHSSSSSSGGQKDLPAAFQTEAGANHLAATSALLYLSQERALQVTMGALRSIDVPHSVPTSSNDGIPSRSPEEEKKEEGVDSSSNNNNFASLLGSRELLVKTMLYHYQQRFARLSIITECLRLEQDPDFVQKEAVVDFLNSLDATFTNSIGNGTDTVDRGLLKSLLTVACQPEPEPSRQALEPSKVLEDRSDDMSSSYRSQGGRPLSDERSFQAFCVSLMAEQKAQNLRERTEAMEGLLVLLYERIQGGVLRSDYSLLLMAFFSLDGNATSFSVACGEQPRLSHLKGLICAECMALWRGFESTETGDDNSSVDNSGDTREVWPVSSHPMLMEWTTEAGGKELESLYLILKQLVDIFYSGIAFETGESPVSLAVLSFGLLLSLVQNARSDAVLQVENANRLDIVADADNFGTLRDVGSQLVHTANDVCGAFDYLMTVLDALTSASLATMANFVVRDVSYDWQLSESRKDDTLLLENGCQSTVDAVGEENSTPADIVTYASIAREVIAASIAAFPETLAIDQPISCQDLRLLCTVTAKIYENNGRLCQQFWDVWELFVIESSNQQDQRLPSFPICRLLEGAHKFATVALNSLWNQQISSHSYISAASPFFQLLAALCHTPRITESIIGMLPTTMIRSTLLCCENSSRRTQNSKDDVENIVSILNAFQTIAAVSKQSKSCLELLRNSLEVDPPPQMKSPERSTNRAFDGPRILASILNAQRNSAIINPVLGIMAHLLDDAPSGWVQLLTLEFVERAGPNPTSRLIPFMNKPGDEVSHSAVLVLGELISHVDSVVFSDGLSAKDAVAFLQSLGAALLSASTCLSTWFSKGALPSTGSVFVETADSVLRSFANFLKLVRTVILLQTSPKVCETATLMRDRLIGTLATSAGLGESIVYYAIAPVSLGIVVKMEDVIRDKSLLEQLAKKSGDGSASLWQTRTASYGRGSLSLDMAKSQISKFISTMEQSDFDIEGVRARGWVHSQSSSGLASMDAAFSALDLLTQWAAHVEDIAQSHSNDLANQSFPLSGKAAELIAHLSPQRLLCTCAPMPPCRANFELSMLWESIGVSTVELMLPYLQKEGRTTEKDSDLPVSVTLDLLMACISQVVSTTSAKNITDASLIQVVYSNTQFSSFLWKIVDNGFRIAESFNSSNALSNEEKSHMVHFFQGLRIISKCVSSDATVAVKVLHLADDRLITKLVKGALRAREILDLSGTKRIFHTDDSILGMRIASGCMYVLSTLWKTTRSISPTNVDPVRMLLIQTVDQQSSFVRELAKLASSFAAANNLDERIAVSSDSDCARVSMLTFLEAVFDVLATEAVYSASTDGGVLASDILMEFAQSRQLLGFQGYQLSADSAVMFAEAQASPELKNLDPSVILRCFPVTSSNILSNDFYVKDNAFNLNSSMKFLAKIDVGGNALLDDSLKKVSLSYLQCHSELALMWSWGRFLSLTLLTVSESSGNQSGSTNPEQISVFAGDCLQALSENISSASIANVGNLRNRPTTDVIRMTKILSDLLLTQLEFGAFTTLAQEELLILLNVLCKSVDGFHDMTYATTNGSDLESLYSVLESLLASALVICGLIEREEKDSRPSDNQAEVYAAVCLANCKFLQSFSSLWKNGNSSANHMRGLRLSAALFTLIIVGSESCSNSNTGFKMTIAGMLEEYEAPKQLMQYAASLASVAATSMARTENQLPPPQVGNVLAVVEAVYDLLFAVADTNDPSLVAVIRGIEFSKLVVRNDLFALRAPLWSLPDSSGIPPRGYVVAGDTVMLSSRQSSLYVGNDDKVHGIWISSMKVLRASVRASSQASLGSSTVNLESFFIELAIEFLKMYRNPLFACLKSCGPMLTRNALDESSALLALVAELCKRNIREAFIQSRRELCDEFVAQSKYVVVSLSKFLGATGTSRELFMIIQEYENSDPDRFGEEMVAPLSKVRLPLFTQGLPSAKHEAIKYSHFASSCKRQMTKADFEAAASIPDHLKPLSVERHYESDLERNCRLSVTSNFSFQLVEAAALTLQHALSLIWRTHPVSMSFYTFSNADQTMDVMALVDAGIVVGFQMPYESTMYLDDSRTDFESMSFGKVVMADTVKRRFRVQVLRQPASQKSWFDDETTINAGQVVGIEDKLFRKPSTLLRPAPDSMAAFELGSANVSTGNYILTLRWCHQQITVALDKGLDAGFTIPHYIRQIAEETAVILGADLVLHEIVGSFVRLEKKEISQLDSQLFELFADKAMLDGSLETELDVATFTEGRMKGIVSPAVWDGVQQQVLPFVERAWKEMKDAARKRKERQTGYGGSSLFSGIRQKGQRNAFRGLS